MYTHKTKLRVRYGETDQMKYAYYGVYAQYFEVGRVELLRSLGITYKELEDLGVNFRSNCDTEILIESISYWGIEKTLKNKIKRAVILPEAKHSDHCPALLELDHQS